jgi:hypothetical protein
MPRLSKFDKIMPQVLAADWVSRRHMLSDMRRLSYLAPHLVLMLTACQSSLSDYLVAPFSARGRLTPSDIQVAHASL